MSTCGNLDKVGSLKFCSKAVHLKVVRGGRRPPEVATGYNKCLTQIFFAGVVDFLKIVSLFESFSILFKFSNFI